MPTTKQKRAVANIVGNGGNVTKAMRDAGYSEGTVNTPQKLTDSVGYKEAAKPLVARLQEQIDSAIEQMTIKTDKATYSDHRQAVKDFVVTKELLEGRATKRTSITIKGVEDIPVDDLDSALEESLK